MHFFQFIADTLHVLSFIILIRQVLRSKTVSELSYRTQEIYIVVFITRYMDLFLYYVSLYNTIYKLLFISCTGYIIYLIKFCKPYCLGYDKSFDKFNHYLFIYPTVLVWTILFHLHGGYYEYFEYFWSFSIWLEAFAIIPQLYIVKLKKEVTIVTGTFLTVLGLYRLFYIINWIVIFMAGEKLVWIKFIAGLIQTGLYADFIYVYFKSIHNHSGGSIKFPI